jgi:hypothetical protein
MKGQGYIAMGDERRMGAQYQIGNQVFTVIRRDEQYRLVWQSECAHCGAPFETRVKQMGGGKKAMDFRARRCPEHRGMGPLSMSARALSPDATLQERFENELMIHMPIAKARKIAQRFAEMVERA